MDSRLDEIDLARARLSREVPASLEDGVEGDETHDLAAGDEEAKLFASSFTVSKTTWRGVVL